jgi:hypothetical protein
MTYQRLMSEVFLDHCSLRTAAIYRYWSKKKCGRKFPRRQDIDPLEMKPWLPGLVLVDVKPPRQITYRVVGTAVCQHRGFDPTGRPVEEGLYGNLRDEVLENYRLAIDEGSIVYDYDATPSQSGLAQEVGTLFMPLSNGGDRVDQILIYQDIEALPMK